MCDENFRSPGSTAGRIAADEVTEAQTLGPRDGGKFVYFTDPDGNNWAVQEIRERVGAPLI